MAFIATKKFPGAIKAIKLYVYQVYRVVFKLKQGCLQRRLALLSFLSNNVNDVSSTFFELYNPVS